MEAAGAALGAVLVFGLVIFVVMLLVGALILKFSVALIEKFSPSYGRSLLTVLLASIVSFVISLGLMMVVGLGAMGAGAGADADPAAAMASMGMLPLLANLLSFVISFLVMAVSVNLLIKRPDGSELGFGRACLVSVLYWAVMVVLMVVLGIVLALVFGAALLGAAGLAG